MRFTILSSGSKGNALVVESGDTAVMVDAGLGPRTLSERMRQSFVDARKIRALCITHNHYDHAKCASAVAESLNVPTLATEACAKAHLRNGVPFFAHQAIRPSDPVTVGSLKIRCFSTPHDAPGSVGLVFEDGDAKMAVLTDLGHVHNALVDAVKGVNLFYLEFNHDREMLRTGPYPGSLKNRVASNYGHLSNEQGADLLARSRTGELTHLVLAHLSETNNTPQLAHSVAQRVLDGSGVRISVAPQHHAMGPIKVAARQRDLGNEPVMPLPVRMPLPIPTLGGTGVTTGDMGIGPSRQLSLFSSAK